MERAERLVGCLIGTAVGDSLLLPAEGLSRSRIARRFPGPLRQRLVFGRGMVSDDTEHAFLTTQAMLVAGDDVERFARALASCLRWWLLSLPGGCGLATAKGLLRSWLSGGSLLTPEWGRKVSAGNGAAMRAAIIGLRWATKRDTDQLRAFVTASTVITHRDPRALTAALAVATAAAAIASEETIEALWAAWRDLSPDPAWLGIMAMLERAYAKGATVDEVAAELGCPTTVTGYAYHSVPVALYAWLRHRGDPAACLEAILRCGGDTDSIGAIAGALFGADGGEGAFPLAAWDREVIVDWPLTLGTLRAAGSALAGGANGPVRWWWPMQPLRNAVFLVVILAHGLRRLLL